MYTVIHCAFTTVHARSVADGGRGFSSLRTGHLNQGDPLALLVAICLPLQIAALRRSTAQLDCPTYSP